MRNEIKWLESSSDLSYSSAESYLSLLFDPIQVESIIENLKKASISEFKVRDILRASKLPIFGISKDKINDNLDKIESKEELAPILLIRDPRRRDLIIADGYHIVCSIFSLGHEEMLIKCKIISI